MSGPIDVAKFIHEYLKDNNIFWRTQSGDIQNVLDELIDALTFYANPDSYFAIAFFPDPPCGEFMEDFSNADHLVEWGPYNREMPGKLARTVLGIEKDTTPL